MNGRELTNKQRAYLHASGHQNIVENQIVVKRKDGFAVVDKISGTRWSDFYTKKFDAEKYLSKHKP